MDPQAPQMPPSTETGSRPAGKLAGQPEPPSELLSGLPLMFTDEDGDEFEVKAFADALAVSVNLEAAYLSREDVLSVHHALGDWLMAQQALPDPSPQDVPLADWERDLLAGVEPPTITEDAQAAVYSDREDDYGHPRENLTRTAVLWTGLLQHVLAEGAYVDAPDVARCMIGMKLARDVHAPTRDNRVDMAGYALILDRLVTGR